MQKYFDYKNLVNSLLKDKKVEGIPIENTHLIKKILLENDIGKTIYMNFLKNLYTIDDYEDMYATKIQDLVYTMHLIINKWLIPYHNLSNDSLIKIIQDLVNKDNIDIYSAINYNSDDDWLINEFEQTLYGRKINI